MTAEPADTDRIERDLAQTRARMDRRLDELGDRLAPDQIVDDALSHVTGGSGADFTQTLIMRARANPLAAGLAGIGLVWLLASSRSTPAHAHADLRTRLRSAEAGVVRIPDEHPDMHASRIDDARGQVLGVARASSDTAAAYAQRIKDAMATASRGVREGSRDLSGASRADSRGAGSPSGPLALGAVAALAGIVAGALIPISGQEERALGGFGHRLRGQGRDMAQDAVDRATKVAGDAIEAAKESIQALP